MTGAGAWHSEIVRRTGATLAALALAIALAPGSRACAQDTPITAADAERAGTLGAASGEAVAASAPSPAYSAPTGAPPVAEASPIGAATPSAPPPGADEPNVPVAVATVDEIPDRPVITSPMAPPLTNPSSDQVFVGPPGTEEIPQATAPGTPAEPPPGATTPPTNDDLTRYQYDQDPQLANTGSLRDFVAEGDETSPIGVELRETTRKLKTGEEAEGLLVIKVERNSAASKAGLRPYRRTAHNMLMGAAIGAAMVFAPAILVLPIIDYTQVGESYDMIIGVDGTRVTNFIDFEERMRNLVPGELV